MASNTKYGVRKTTVGGVRQDSAPSSDDGDLLALRLDSDSALIVSTGGSGGSTISVDGDGSHAEATLLDLTNIATNTTGYGYLDMDGYRYFALQGETSGTAPTDTLTVTIEATIQDDGTAQASCTYQDVTSTLFGVANWVDTDFMAVCDVPVSFKYVRVKYVTSNDAGSDCDLQVYAKRTW